MAKEEKTEETKVKEEKPKKTTKATGEKKAKESQPKEKATKKSTGKTTGKSTGKTAEKPAEKAAEKPTEKTAEKTAEKPAETPVEQATDASAPESNSENFEFQSEVKQLLNILVYSLYQHKEVFIRELISNSVDALNKVQFETLTNSDIEDKGLDLKIDISFDTNKNKFIIEDTGVGMTKEELIQNIGTIAHSGTVEFLKRMTESEEADASNLIGQFGVGFYSSFMTAEEIHVHTKSYKKGSKGLIWKSKGDNNFTIEEKGKKTRGTRIELFLKEDEKEFLEKTRVKHVIEKHSRFVPFPINIESDKIESMEALWTQPKSSLKEKDYNEFYKFFENAYDEPETYLHLSSDAPVQFNSIMYVPKSNFEVYGHMKTDPGVDLYSKKVLIQKGCKEIMPDYMRFIKGVIDSEDIPLNISRETIQSNMRITKIRNYVLKKLFDNFVSIKEKDKPKYITIWKNFHRNFKEGIISDFENRPKLAPLLFFHSSKKNKEDYTDLAGYLERMPEEQKEIYYITGKDFDAIEKNPAMEAFRKKDLEVLYLTDPMDEVVMEHMQEHDGKKFKMAENADIKLDDDAEKKEEEKDKEYLKDVENFISYLKNVYGEKIGEVKISKRLVDSPCVMVNAEGGPSIHMEMILKMQNKGFDFSKKVLEINSDNELIKEMVTIHKDKPASTKLRKLSLQLLDNMVLRAGIIEEIDNVVPRMQEIMLMAAKSE
ncbi:MAG: molecular chaperone HtpG [bacterium]|nr:molecular chaperone HtpG [bacterium]